MIPDANANEHEKLGYGEFHRVDVIVVTASYTFTGYGLCYMNQRLLDALNKGFFTSELQTVHGFLPLNDVKVYSRGNAEQHLDTTDIPKNNIMFVGELTAVSKMASTVDYPKQDKKSLRAIVNLPTMSLSGNLYCEVWEEFRVALYKTDQFLPMTDVNFNNPTLERINHLSFAAINKDHIIYVGK